MMFKLPLHYRGYTTKYSASVKSIRHKVATKFEMMQNPSVLLLPNFLQKSVSLTSKFPETMRFPTEYFRLFFDTVSNLFSLLI